MPAETCCATVVTPAFNSARTLPRAAVSVLRQSLRELELIIVDDGSSDDTLAVARAIALGDERVQVIALPANRGKPHVMNLAMTKARGQWIAVLDADDWYDRDRLATLIGVGEEHGVDLVADNQLFFDDGIARVVQTALPVTKGRQCLDKGAFAAGCDPYAAFDYGMLKPVVRADFLARTGLHYRENARLSEDFFFMVEFFAAGGQAMLVNTPLYYWRQAFGSVSRRWTDTGAGRWRYDFGSALRANAEVLSEMAVRDEPELTALLTARAVAFRRLAWLADINRLRAGGSIAQAAMRALQHPSIWREAGRRAARAGLARIGIRHRLQHQPGTDGTGALVKDGADTVAGP